MAQLSLSRRAPLITGRRTSESSRVIRHQLLAFLTGALRATDIIGAPLCGLFAYYLRYESFAIEFNHGILLLLGMVVIANVMALGGVYDPGYLGTFRAQLIKVVAGWAATICILLVLAFFDKITDQYSRLWIAYWFVAGASLSVAARLAAAAYFDHRRRAGNLSIKVAIVGRDPFAQHVMRQITWPGDIDVKVVGVFAPELEGSGAVASDATVDGLMRLARRTHIDEIIIHLPEQRDADFSKVLWKLSELPVNVNLCPDLSDLPISPRKLTVLQQTFMINIAERPFSGWSAVAKRVEDIVLSSLLLLLFAPLMLIIALLIKLDSPGPALFRQRRWGFNNNLITVYKFRTMTAEASNDATAPQARRNDPRITRVGKFLRRTSLDELPQLLNVLKGEMSLVGPRPHPITLNERFAAVIDGYLRRHRVKPGITGWAQVNGWRGETASDEAMHQRVKYDLEYIENWSLAFDFWILLRTTFSGFVHRNAF